VSVVLGLNEFFHDTAAAVVVDGELRALVEQERLDRRKHAPGFALGGPAPWAAVDWCLERAGLRYADVDVVAASFQADALRSLAILGQLVRGNRGRSSLRGTLRNRFRYGDPALDFLGGLTLGQARRRVFLRKLAARCQAPVEKINHHLAHAASAFYPSGFERSAVIVIDGMGDATPTSIWDGRDGRLALRRMESDPANSLGVLYRTISLALGFSFMDAGKTMGLAAYGEPDERFTPMLQEHGDWYRIDWPLVKRIAGEHARSSGELQDVHRAMAASLQRQLERVGLRLARTARALTGSTRLCLAGGVALNCNMNSRILLQGGLDGLYIQPGAMDMGCALGAAQVQAQRVGDEPGRAFSVYCGPEASDAEIEAALRARGLPYRRVDDPVEEAASLLSRDEVLGWFQGPMEFGPRALGARSILANPARVATRDRVNRIKRREMWRPLAPAMLEERLGEWFREVAPTPHMTLTFQFLPEQARRVPAVVHRDGSARVQSVSRDDLPIFHALLRRFEDKTGLPVVMNTSFNDRGEPIVCTPAQAVRTFQARKLDALVIGQFMARPFGARDP